MFQWIMNPLWCSPILGVKNDSCKLLLWVCSIKFSKIIEIRSSVSSQVKGIEGPVGFLKWDFIEFFNEFSAKFITWKGSRHKNRLCNFLLQEIEIWYSSCHTVLQYFFDRVITIIFRGLLQLLHSVYVSRDYYFLSLAHNLDYKMARVRDSILWKTKLEYKTQIGKMQSYRSNG